MTTEYTLSESTPSAEDFCRLRKIAGLSARPLAAAEIGLPRSCYGVHILWQGTPVGMGRIVGDGALNFEIFDIAVDPEPQGKGLGRKIMEALVSWLNAHAFKGSYVSLVADVPELYAKFGFESVRPESEGMARVWK